MPVKKIVRNKQEILAGSSLLSVEGETLQSRNEFMIEHMADNKAFIHAKETYQNIQPKIPMAQGVLYQALSLLIYHVENS